MAYEYRYRRFVQWVDTDNAGIIHFSNYFRYMEEAETQFLRSLGFNTIGEGDIILPRVSAACDFIKAVKFADEIDIHVWIARKGRTSIGYEYSFTCKGDEVAHGKVTAVCVKKDASGALQSTPIPPGLDAALEVAPFATGA